MTVYGRTTIDLAVVYRGLSDWLPSRSFFHSFYLCGRVFVKSVDSRIGLSIILLIYSIMCFMYYYTIPYLADSSVYRHGWRSCQLCPFSVCVFWL